MRNELAGIYHHLDPNRLMDLAAGAVALKRVPLLGELRVLLKPKIGWAEDWGWTGVAVAPAEEVEPNNGRETELRDHLAISADFFK